MVHLRTAVSVTALLVAAAAAAAQGTLADYQRAHDLQVKAHDLVIHIPGDAHWIGSEHRFWYARNVKGGFEFILVDADKATSRVAFDHEKLAVAVSAVTAKHYSAQTLPFDRSAGRDSWMRAERDSLPLSFENDEKAIQFSVDASIYKCDLVAYTCQKTGPLNPEQPHRGSTAPGPRPVDPGGISPEGSGGNPVDGIAYAPAVADDDQGHEDPSPKPCSEEKNAPAHTRHDGQQERPGVGSPIGGQLPPEPSDVCASFDGKWEAFIRDFNVYLKPVGKGDASPLSFDGSENNYYSLRSIAWSPNSRKLVAYHTRPGFNREVMYIESSPSDQLQPKHMTIDYAKPGDPVDTAYPVLFDVDTRQGIEIDHALFPNAYDLSMAAWWKDGRGFTFEYNQRGHQSYKIIEADSTSGQTRALVDEEVPTFFYYSDLGPGLSAGRRFRYDVQDGKEIIWASERDGWEHLYLYDGATGKTKNQITRGAWLVREVVYVDEQKRQVWFAAGGSVAGQDPYFTQYYRINFDGTGLTRLTAADGTHAISFSKDRAFYVDTWQRVDLAPVAQLRHSEDQRVVLDLDRGDTTALIAAGFHAPEVFVAKGRDSKTDIWGTITRPLHFDPEKKYPVIENIYAGPQGSFVPKTFSAIAPDQSLAELGFIVVHIDGMGTSNRSKAFHDVAWKNLADAGFPDRILWHKAVAQKYPWYDITRVGIFGTSAGGQSAMGAVLFHPEFYKVAVTNSGCHDNRMDKMWWNEQWMGYPVGPQYAASSNVENAFRLQGSVLIVAGEMDTNVDPASSLQVVNALVKAKKHFDMLYVPGQNHGVGGLAGQHYTEDYFVRHLLGVETPDWNRVSLKDAEEKHETTASAAAH